MRLHGGLVGDATGGGADGERGEGAGLPEADELRQLVEDAGEASDDHRFQGVGQPAPPWVRRDGGTQAGELVGQGCGLN